MPVSTAIGDTTYFIPLHGKLIYSFNILNSIIAKKGDDGAPITAPRNFTTKKVKKGHVDSVLFSKPDYIAIGDPY